MEKKDIVTYVGFVMAIASAATGVFGWFPAEVAWGIAGLFGFGTLAAARTFIAAKGWKTYVIDIPTALLGIVTAMGFITLDLYAQIMVVIGMLNAGTLAHANSRPLE